MKPGNSVFSFDPIKHIYWLNGEIIPGFTEIVKANGLVDFSYVSPEHLERCRQFGSNLHLAIKLYNKGSLNMEVLDPGLIPGVLAWGDFLEKTGYKVVQECSEQPICSEFYRFGCTPDNVIIKNSKYGIAEVKSSVGTSPFMRLQTAAQKIAIKEFYGIKILERLVIQVPFDGGLPKVVEHKDKRDEAFFLNCLGVYKFKRENNLLKKE